ncbi:MAG: hypothetical protein KGJ79_15405 [Alphaproteobacteria bacterium]|nr:hypothetical protein [Alphaproteobacteria bacterium]MDE2112528.1 hypothetical protein [Alphaproteobacteria bacterium]MDE2492920.1 hypothetical protein [Alphaproteobacteria bacterium]
MTTDRWLGILLVGAAGFLPLSAGAQTTDVNGPVFQNFIRSRDAIRLLGEAIQNLPRSRLGGCQSDFNVSTMQYIVTEPMTFEGSGPTSGQWKTQLMVRACHRQIPLNVYFTVKSPGNIQYEYGLSGATDAGLEMQQAALPAAYRAAVDSAKDCTQFDASIANFGGYGLPDDPQPKPATGAQSYTWWETWVVRGCGNSYEVPMGFETKAGQTTVHAYGAKVVEHKG